MTWDFESLLAEEQTIAATGFSTDALEFPAPAPGIGGGQKKYLAISCTTAMTGTTPSFTFALYDCDTESGTYVQRVEGPALTSMAVGEILLIPLPDSVQQFVKGHAEVAGTSPSIGVTWGLVTP